MNGNIYSCVVKETTLDILETGVFPVVSNEKHCDAYAGPAGGENVDILD